MMRSVGTEPPAASEALRRATDALGRLVREHISLARAELKQDVRVAARDMALVLAGVPVLIVGWAILMLAIAAALSPTTGVAGALAAVGAANLLGGGGFSAWFAWKLSARDRPDLDRTTNELREDRRWLSMLVRSRGAAGRV